MRRFVVLDVETTGLSPIKGDRIIEIALVEINAGLITGKEYHVFVNPGVFISNAAYKIHGITNSFLLGKPCFGDISTSLISFIADAPLVAHNAAFDARFLFCEFQRLAIPFNYIFIDTLRIFQKLFPGRRNNLIALCKRYAISYFRQHSALHDARVLAMLFLKLLRLKHMASAKVA
ncbi:3'-5' exoribonuclease [Candidatus Vidania fulgoroideae]|uniref:DNA-directed DNA polymerase n=1 Tax=Candidatus Vidania fulgoroideorum TaxID=881286 RepID=A0A975AE37_9PROT|nr:3'-5' exoribonuclease [Candidatus Vidania fulgoroideae]